MNPGNERRGGASALTGAALRARAQGALSGELGEALSSVDPDLLIAALAVYQEVRAKYGSDR